MMILLFYLSPIPYIVVDIFSGVPFIVTNNYPMISITYRVRRITRSYAPTHTFDIFVLQ